MCAASLAMLKRPGNGPSSDSATAADRECARQSFPDTASLHRHMGMTCFLNSFYWIFDFLKNNNTSMNREVLWDSKAGQHAVDKQKKVTSIQDT